MTRAGLAGLAAYRPGKPIATLQKEKGIESAIKLASNENPLGASPLAVEAARAAAVDLNRYPEGSGAAVRDRLAGLYGISADEIILGSGSSEVLALALSAFVDPGEEVVLPTPSFSIYGTLVLAAGGTPVPVRLEPDFSYNLKEFEKRLSERTKAVILCSPNNPTGTIVRKADLRAFAAGLPRRTLLVLDEAYAEYAESPDFESGLTFFRERPLVVARTFSKLYALAALRIGYAVSGRVIIEEMNKIRPPFNTTVPAQAAAAAVLDDRKFIAASLKNNREGKEFLGRALAGLKLDFTPSEANFILVDFQGGAPEICARLEDLGVIVRPLDNPELRARYLRVTVGTPAENRRFIEGLRTVLGPAG